MAIGVLVLDLEIVGAQSLKEKRSALKSLKERLQVRFRVAAAETDYLDRWQRAELTVCAVSADGRQTEQVLQSVDRFVAADPRVRIIGTHRSSF